MRISDWSSDVCSSDLRVVGLEIARHVGEVDGHVDQVFPARAAGPEHRAYIGEHRARLRGDVVGDKLAIGIVFVAGHGVAGRIAWADAGKQQQVADAARMRICPDRARRAAGVDATAHAASPCRSRSFYSAARYTVSSTAGESTSLPSSRTRPSCRLHTQPCTDRFRSEEHTSELQSLMRISYAVFCLKKKTKTI